MSIPLLGGALLLILSRGLPCWRGNPEQQGAECPLQSLPDRRAPLSLTEAHSCKSVESEVHRSPGGNLRELALVALSSLLAHAFRKPQTGRKRAPGTFIVVSEPVVPRGMLGGVLQDRCGCMLQLCALSPFRSLSRSALVQLDILILRVLRGCWSKSRAFRGSRPGVIASGLLPIGHCPRRIASMR